MEKGPQSAVQLGRSPVSHIELPQQLLINVFKHWLAPSSQVSTVQLLSSSQSRVSYSALHIWEGTGRLNKKISQRDKILVSHTSYESFYRHLLRLHTSPFGWNFTVNQLKKKIAEECKSADLWTNEMSLSANNTFETRFGFWLHSTPAVLYDNKDYVEMT